MSPPPPILTGLISGYVGTMKENEPSKCTKAGLSSLLKHSADKCLLHSGTRHVGTRARVRRGSPHGVCASRVARAKRWTRSSYSKLHLFNESFRFSFLSAAVQRCLIACETRMTGTNKVTCRLCESFRCALRAAEPLFVREVRVLLQGRTSLVGHASRKFQMRHSVLAMKWPRHAWD